MLDEVKVEKIINMFWEEISDMSWDDWCDTSTTDKERIVVDVYVRLDNPTLDIDEVYEIFWDWANGLDESSFVDFN